MENGFVVKRYPSKTVKCYRIHQRSWLFGMTEKNTRKFCHSMNLLSKENDDKKRILDTFLTENSRKFCLANSVIFFGYSNMLITAP